MPSSLRLLAAAVPILLLWEGQPSRPTGPWQSEAGKIIANDMIDRDELYGLAHRIQLCLCPMKYTPPALPILTEAALASLKLSIMPSPQTYPKQNRNV